MLQPDSGRGTVDCRVATRGLAHRLEGNLSSAESAQQCAFYARDEARRSNVVAANYRQSFDLKRMSPFDRFTRALSPVVAHAVCRS